MQMKDYTVLKALKNMPLTGRNHRQMMAAVAWLWWSISGRNRTARNDQTSR